MKRIIPLIALIITFLSGISAQNTDVISATSHQYMLDNPATVGLDGRHHIFVGANRKWFGLEQAPQTYFISSSHPIINRAFGIGGTIVQQRAGLLSDTRLSAQGAIHFNPESDNVISLGVSARMHFYGLNAPNVVDVIDISGFNAGKLNVGAGLNLHSLLQGRDNSFFNLSVLMTQLPSSLTFDASTPIDYRVPNYLVLQSNLRYQITDAVALMPSLRYQIQASGGYGGKTQAIDLSIGASFAEDRIHARLGTRTGQATLFYGGIGMRIGDNIFANIFAEPGGPLGSSGTFDAEYVFGEVKAICWNNTTCLREKLVKAGIAPSAITTQVFPDPDFGQTTVQFSFTDNVNAYHNYFEHSAFVQQKRLNVLFREMEKLIQEIEADGGKVTQVSLLGTTKNSLSQLTSERSRDEATFSFDYFESGKTTNLTLQKGKQMTEGQLTALKLKNLSTQIKNDIPALRKIRPKIDVKRNTNLLNNRDIAIRLTVVY